MTMLELYEERLIILARNIQQCNKSIEYSMTRIKHREKFLRHFTTMKTELEIELLFWNARSEDIKKWKQESNINIERMTL